MLLLCSIIFIVGLPVHDGTHAAVDYKDCHQCILKGSLISPDIGLQERSTVQEVPCTAYAPMVLKVALADRLSGFPSLNKAPPLSVS